MADLVQRVLRRPAPASLPLPHSPTPQQTTPQQRSGRSSATATATAAEAEADAEAPPASAHTQRRRRGTSLTSAALPPSSSPVAAQPGPPSPPRPPAPASSLSAFLSVVEASSAASSIPPLPLSFPPFLRPFTSASRGLYEGSLSWPLPALERPGHAPAEDAEADREAPDSSSSFPLPSSLSFSQLSALSSAPFASSAYPSRPPPFLPPQLDLPYHLTSSSLLLPSLASLAAPPLQERPARSPSPLLPPSPAQPSDADAGHGSRNRLLLLRLSDSADARQQPTSTTLLLLHPTGPLQDHLTLFTQPCLPGVTPSHRIDAAVPPSDSSTQASIPLVPSTSTSSPLVASLTCSSLLDSAILHVTSTHPDASLPRSIFSSPSSLPLVIAHTATCAYVHRILRVESDWGLLCIDAFTPYTPPLLCLAANTRLCSTAHCEVACVDAGGCIYTWTMELTPTAAAATIAAAHSGEVDRGQAGQAPRPVRAAATLGGEHRRVTATLRSFYEEPLQLLQRPLLSFARCAFGPHPRSLLLAFSDRLLQVDLTTAAALDSSPTGAASFAPSLARPLPLPPLSAVSVPVNRFRHDPPRPQPLRDHYFRHQPYRQPTHHAGNVHNPRHTNTQANRPLREEDAVESVDAAAGTAGDDGMEEQEEENADGDSDVTIPSGRRSAGLMKGEGAEPDLVDEKPHEMSMESDASGHGDGHIVAMCGVCEWPHLLLLLTSSFLLLVDIRHSAQPLLEWQLPRPLLLPAQLTAVVPPDEGSRRSLLLLVANEALEEVDVYHCYLTTAPALAAVSPFAPLRLAPFPHVQPSSPSSFQLLPPPRTSLTGLALVVVVEALATMALPPLPPLSAASSPTAAAGRGEAASLSALPPFRVFHLSSTGVILSQDWSSGPASDTAEDDELELDPDADAKLRMGRPLSRFVESRMPPPPSLSLPSTSPLWPSDAAPPIWLTRSSVNPSDRLDLTPLFYSHRQQPHTLTAHPVQPLPLAVCVLSVTLTSLVGTCKPVQVCYRDCRSPHLRVSWPAILTCHLLCDDESFVVDVLCLSVYLCAPRFMHRRGHSVSASSVHHRSRGCVSCAGGQSAGGAQSVLHCPSQRVRDRSSCAGMRLDRAAPD